MRSALNSAIDQIFHERNITQKECAGQFVPKFAGAIYEVLPVPVSYVEVLLGYMGAAFVPTPERDVKCVRNGFMQRAGLVPVDQAMRGFVTDQLRESSTVSAAKSPPMP